MHVSDAARHELQKRFKVQLRQAQPWIECVAIMEPRKGRRAERIAGTDRVHDLDRHRRDAQASISRCAVRSSRSKRDQDKEDTGSRIRSAAAR